MPVDQGRSVEAYTTSSVLWQAVAPAAPASMSLVARVYELLWKQIVAGERRQGERLIDAELVADLQVSRTPIRHALYRLQQAGLIEASTGRGFHVVMFKAGDIGDLYDLRLVLEVAAVRAATAQIPEAALQAALAQLTALRRMAEPALGPEFLRSDVQFHHELIASNSGNRQLAEAVAAKRAQMSIFLVGGTRLPTGVSAALAEHEQILHALLARDAEAAARAMAQHIQRVKDDVVRHMAAEQPARVRRVRIPRAT